MITGFNTDVRHGDLVFHVQTEDKGTGNPCIESLVYVGGQILARKRAGYRSLLEGDEASQAVAELMERQHRSMIDDIRSGKMDEKVAAIKGTSKAAAASTQVTPPPGPLPPKPAPEPAPKPISETQAQPTEPATAPRPAAAAPAPAEPAEALFEAEPPLDAKTASPRKLPPLPPKPPPRRPPPPTRQQPAASTAPDSSDKSLDQVILDYLEMESGQDKLVLSMDRKSGEMVSGGEAELKFRTESSVDSDPIGQSLITVRLISTFDEPRLLGEGRTDDRGELELTIAIPELQTGSGALIINAESSIGSAEIRHLI